MVLHRRYAIDWYEGDPRSNGKLGQVYYIRPAVRGVTKALDPAWEGECTFLTDKGCSLTPANRPRQCLALTPVNVNGENRCKFVVGHGGKRFAAIAWRPHQKMMRDVVNRIRNSS